jgi:hypothetical protein
MKTLEKKDESIVKDNDKTVKSKFRFAWFEKKMSWTLKNENIRKIDTTGKAFFAMMSGIMDREVVVHWLITCQQLSILYTVKIRFSCTETITHYLFPSLLVFWKYQNAGAFGGFTPWSTT